MGQSILINREVCEVRVAFLEEKQLVELHTEKFDEQTIVNNIYRGKVQDVVPGLQAAFIDVGLERNMFLHFMDIRPESLVLGKPDPLEAMREASEIVLPGRIEQRGRRPRQDPRAPQAAPPVKKGDQIIVQVVKDEIGGKAPRVTANVSLAGRYLVMLPFPSQEGGVSRKIALGQDRFRLKKLLGSLRTEDYSFIVRTAGIEQPEEPIKKDAENLVRTWHAIIEKYQAVNGPGLLFNDHDLISRLVRDALPAEFKEIICDDPADAEAVRILLGDTMPDKVDRVKVYDGVDPLFEEHGVEKQIEESIAKKYHLPSGGSLVIDENEALTAIDVNTGRFTGKRDQEKTSLKTNLEACEAIARQIRVRDLGGIIVVDFIDMLSRSHQEKVSDELKKHLQKDRAKTAVGRIGDFGLMVLTRKRQRMSLQKQVFDKCGYCDGTGYVRKPDEVYRALKNEMTKILASDKKLSGFIVSAHPKLIESLSTRYRVFFEGLKRDKELDVLYRTDLNFHVEDFTVTPVLLPDGERRRLPSARVEEEYRTMDAISYDDAEEMEDVNGPLIAEYEELPVVEEAPSPAPVTPVNAQRPAEESGKREGGRNRRRRRGRGGRGGNGEERQLQSAPSPSTPVPVPVPPPEPIDDEDDEAVEETVASGPAGEMTEEQRKRRTRRGTRGGRNRRRRGEGGEATSDGAVATPTASQPAAPSAPVPSTPAVVAQVRVVKASPTPEPAIKLPPKSNSALLSFLDEIDEQTKKLPAPKPAAEAKAKSGSRRRGSKKAEVKPAAPPLAPPAPKKDPKALLSLLDQIEAETRTGESKAPATKAAASKSKAPKAPAKKKPAAPKKTAPEKKPVAAKAPARKTAAAAKPEKPKAAAKKSPSTAGSTKATKTTAAKGKAPAKKPAARGKKAQ